LAVKTERKRSGQVKASNLTILEMLKKQFLQIEYLERSLDGL